MAFERENKYIEWDLSQLNKKDNMERDNYRKVS